MTSPRTIMGAKSILRFLAPVVLSLLCSSTTLLVPEGSEARYRVIKIIEGSGTTVPEAGGINQKGEVVGSIDVRGHTNFWLWSDGVRQDLPLGNGRSGLGFRSTTGGRWSEFFTRASLSTMVLETPARFIMRLSGLTVRCGTSALLGDGTAPLPG